MAVGWIGDAYGEQVPRAVQLPAEKTFKAKACQDVFMSVLECTRHFSDKAH